MALLSITACGTGLTLNTASHVVFAELDWTPANVLQAEDRAHRIGQKNTVNVHYLLARGTADEHIWQMIESKLSVISAALDGKREGMAAASASHTKASTSAPPIAQFFSKSN